jgi:hypothetical protein
VEHDQRALTDAADALRSAADRLSELADEKGQDDQPIYGPGDAACRRAEDEARWLKAARRELAELLREIEGPNPPPAPRA